MTTLLATHQIEQQSSGSHNSAQAAALAPSLFESVPQHQDDQRDRRETQLSHPEMVLLPGFDVTTDPADAAYLANLERRHIEIAMQGPRDISRAAATLELSSPLFAGMDATPQPSLF